MFNRQPLQPPCPRGFEHVNRYWDERHGVWAAKILPGEFYVTSHGEMIGTVLGSCIAVCIRDVVQGIGGMNHFMLPTKENLEDINWGSNQITAATRYGNWAMEYMLNELYKLGARKQNLEVKVFGGGQVLASMTDIGQNNILFAYDYLHREGLTIKAADVGDVYSRKVLYFPDTGSVKVRRITNTRNDTVISRERDYAARARDSASGNNNIELFD